MPSKKASKKPSSKDFTPELTEVIKAQLLLKKAALAKNINTELDEMREASEGHHLADMDDLGGDANDEEISFKILEIETAELNQIEYALLQIEKGTYGTCEECSAKINPERLTALPFATLCIQCQRAMELENY